MIYLLFPAKFWYTGCPLWCLSCSSWYSPRLPGYFSDDDPRLLSWIFRGFKVLLGSIWLNKNNIWTYSYDKAVNLMHEKTIQFIYPIYWLFKTLSFVQMKIPLTVKVLSSSHLSSNFQPLAGIALTWTLSPGFTRAARLEFSQTTLHWFKLSNNNW